MDVDQTIVDAVRAATDQPSVTINDNFFELGGDSLSAVEIMERVETDLKVEFPLEVLLEAGELRAVSEECKQRLAN